MFRILLWINQWMNETSYESSLKTWGDRKKECDEHNRTVRADPTFPYDAFAQQKLRDPGPPPDAARIMNRSLSDNRGCCGCLVFLGAIVVFFVGLTLFRMTFRK